MDGFNLESSKFLQEGKLLILDFTPILTDEVAGEFNINALLLRIEQAQQKIKADTLIIDSLQSILLGIKNYDPNYELLRLFQWARQKILPFSQRWLKPKRFYKQKSMTNMLLIVLLS